MKSRAKGIYVSDNSSLQLYSNQIMWQVEQPFTNKVAIYLIDLIVSVHIAPDDSSQNRVVTSNAPFGIRLRT